MARATVSTWRRSAEPSSSGGVPTAMSWNSPCCDRLGGVGGEFEAPGVAGCARISAVEARLVDRHLAPVEPLDPRGVDVHAEHVVARIGQARPGDQPDVARAEDRDFHEIVTP